MYGCRSGRTSGAACGTVDAVNVTIGYADGTTHTGMTQAGTCASMGDSGGPFVSGNFAYGLTSAGFDCPGKGPIYYQEVLRAESRLQVRVATTG